MSALEKYSSYKDSGVKWLGKVPVNWVVKSLKYDLSFAVGGTPSSHVSGFYTGTEPWVTIADMNGKYIQQSHFISMSGVRATSMSLTPKGSLLYSFKLSVGQVAFTNQDLYTNEAIASFYPTDEVNLKYWYYSLPVFVIRNANTNIYGAFILNQDLIKNATLLYPPKSEQTKIANFLDAKTTQIDEAITQKEDLIRLLKERRQILIHKAVTQGLDATVKMKDSGVEWIGEIPKHWKMEKVKYIFNLIIDPAPNNNDFELLSIYTEIGVKPRKELAEKGNKASTTDGYWKVRKGDFIVNKLLAWMGAVGLSAYDGVTSPAYDILRAINPIEGVYFHELFRMKVFSQEMKKHSRGIMDMRLRLYFDKFGDIRVPLPPVEEQKEIVKYIKFNSDKIENAIALQEKQIEKIKEYKATMIDSSVTGKVKIS